MALTLIYATLLAFIPYFIAVWRTPPMKWIVVLALLARLVMLFTPVTLSSDVHRYIWEGKVQRGGFNPYRLAPDAGELAGLRDANWERVEHREVPTAYPPLLLLVFRAGKTPFAFKVIFTAFDLATLWLLIKRVGNRAVIWAWNPLVILEFAGNGHAMSAAIFFFVTGLLLLERQLNPCAALAGAALSHIFAVPAVLALRLKSWRFWLGFVVLVGAGLALFADAGTHLVRGLVNFGGRWRFNGSFFELLTFALPASRSRIVFGDIWVTGTWAKLVAVTLLAGIFAWTRWRRYPAPRAALAVVGAVVLLSPTVHPWYVTWLVALCCVEFRVSWLVLSACVIVSYAARITELQTGVWVDSAFVRWIEYAPFFAVWLVDSVRRRQ